MIIAIITIITIISFQNVLCLDCYACRSDVNSQCATNPGKQIDVVECNNNDQCAVVIMGEVTHRNCLSQFSQNCYATDPLCAACKIPLCNDKIFPAERLKCFQCSGSMCFNVTGIETKLSPLPCPKYTKEDRCYTNIISVNNIERGCVGSSTEPCNNVCLKCNYDGCNNELGIFNNTCFQCQYMDGPNTMPKHYDCKRQQQYSYDNDGDQKCSATNLTICDQKSILGHKVKCFTHYNPQTNVVNRGCSTKMGFYPTGILKECYGDNCNTDCLDIKCNVCDMKTDENCRDNTKILKAQKCDNDTFSCFSCEQKDGHVTRGCGFQPTNSEQKCYHCYDMDGCNKNNTRTCYKCTSTQNENCIELKDDTTGIEHELCKSTTEQCVATISSNGNYTVRGCSSSVIECTEGDPVCQRCSGSLCNIGPLSIL